MQKDPKFIITAAAALVLACSTLSYATSDDAKATDPAPSKNADNTGRNVADRDDKTLTPMDQGNSKADLATTAQIRKEIVAAKNMSINAQNIKIITNGGKVTLRGPVNSAEEKRFIAEIAEKNRPARKRRQPARSQSRHRQNDFRQSQRRVSPMSKKSVFCIATSREQADRIVDQLKIANFSNNDISVLFPDKDTTRDFAHEKNTKAPEGAAAGAGTGGVVGGALGWIAGIGALAIPGVGPFVAAGPIMAALGGAAIGAAAGGIAGALIGMGIPELEAKRYEGKVKAGNLLISVHTESSDEIKRAKQIFTNAGAQDICTTGEASTPKEMKASDRPSHSDFAKT